MFDAVIQEAAERFGLGGKAKMFVDLLLGQIFDPDRGGIAGLQGRFADAGLGDLLNSWIGGHAADNVLQPDQFSAILGQDQVTRIATRLGIPNALVTLAGATLLPRLVSLLTRGGTLPGAPPPEAALLSLDGDLGAAPPRPANPAPAAAPAALRSYTPLDSRRSSMGWLKWLVPLLLIIAVVLMLRSCKDDEVINPPPPELAATPLPPAPAPAVVQPAARFGMENTGGKVSVKGQLASEAEKARLWQALTATFGAAYLSGDITVDPATLPADWIDKLVTVLPALKADGLRLGFDGDRLELDTSVMNEQARYALSDRMRSLFSGYQISGLWDPAAAAVTGLEPGFSAETWSGR